jgi:NADH:ubiquinone oxidoreductase subunit 5 (subunit L)/multisubunit Na+/H+ antiporter MnhA subunit
VDVIQSATVGLAIATPLLLAGFMLTAAISRTETGKLTPLTLGFFGTIWTVIIAALGLVIFNGSVNFSLVTLGGNSIFGFAADRLSIVILLLVAMVSGIVHLYSIRAMQEEPKFRRYFFLLSLVTLEVMLVVLANNLLMLATFWILKGFTLTYLLAHYEERAASWQAAFRKLRIDLIGAGAFVGALALTWNIFGTFDIAAINAIATSAPETLPAERVTLLTFLLLVAIMAKSAQFPLHNWLPQSVEAPTPVSALMHAGLINAGGFLFIRLSPLFLASSFTMTLAVIVGGFTALYGTLIMLTRNDVKGMLVYSTMGQMGFMILQCGLGAFGLAIFHIIAHGLFKATLFLSSGSVIQQKAVYQHLTPATSEKSLPVFRVLLMGAIAAVVCFATPFVFGYEIHTGTVLVAFAVITMIYAVAKANTISTFGLSIATATVSFVYIVAAHAIEVFFAPVVAPLAKLDWGLALGISGIILAAGIALLILQNATRRPVWLDNFIKKLYVRTLFTGYSR